MIPNISKALNWLKDNPQTLKGIKRGLERETLRVNIDGSIATTNHPEILGSALTHKWITTDFSEALLEFITPVSSNIAYMLKVMCDIHRHTARNLGNERMWPLSIPYYTNKKQKIELAQYGTSNLGRLKTLYREGLKNRYGALIQIIAGVHYNFSLPLAFWKTKCGKIGKDVVSAGYFCLIRNYYRFGWIIPYLFGASPAVCYSFLEGKSTTLPFKKTNFDMYYLPYATSLRLSNFGYTNRHQNNFGIMFNELREYTEGLKRAINTPSKKYQRIGLEKEGRRLQISINMLQIENEFYAPIRPKRIIREDETLSDALLLNGIEYIEVRSLDINPFSPIGIDEQQIRFLDLFMVWCVLADAPKMSHDELLCTSINWNRVILEGRKPGLMLDIGCRTMQCPLLEVGKDLFCELLRVANMLDSIFGGKAYQKVCNELVKYFDNSDLTFSARILRSMIEDGIEGIGCSLAAEYHEILQKEPLEVLRDEDFAIERDASITRQYKIEATDNESFSAFLAKKPIKINNI